MTQPTPRMPCPHENVSDTGRCDACGSWLADYWTTKPDVPPSDQTIKNLAKIDRLIT